MNVGPSRTVLTPATTLRSPLWIFPISGRKSCEPARMNTRNFVPNSPLDRARDPRSIPSPGSVISLNVQGTTCKGTCEMWVACGSPTQKGKLCEFVNMLFERYSLMIRTQDLVPPYSGCKRDGESMRCHRVSRWACAAPVISWESRLPSSYQCTAECKWGMK